MVDYNDYETGLYQCFTIHGLLKILESLSVFVCLMLHRIGNRTNQIFFGATDMELNYDDKVHSEPDAEMLGVGATTAFTIITPIILIAYAVEGRKRIQSTSIDAIFSFLGAALLISAGAVTCFAWNSSNSGSMNNLNINRRDMEAAGALGVMTLATGVLYLVDFFIVMYQQALHRRDEYYN